MLGILLDASIFNHIPSGRTKHEKIRYYVAAGKKHGLKLCFFRLQDMDFKRKTVRAYVWKGRTFSLMRLPIPKVIHNRSMTFSRIARNKLRLLSRRGYRIYNRRTRYRKLNIHNRLKRNAKIRPHLPDTAYANRNTLAQFMGKYRSIILKPDNSSVGLGIMKVEKRGSYWVLHVPRSRFGSKWRKVRFTRKLPDYVLKKIQSKRYLVQQTIPLATANGRPFDFRVSVQRNGSGKWQITGVVGKLAGEKKFLTNVAQGGRIYRLPALLKHYPALNQQHVMREMKILSLRIARTLAKSLPNLADLGLDIGIDRRGKPYFIECNARDLRYSFQKGKMRKVWRMTYENPVAYGRYLLHPREAAISRRKHYGEAAESDQKIAPAHAEDGTYSYNSVFEIDQEEMERPDKTDGWDPAAATDPS